MTDGLLRWIRDRVWYIDIICPDENDNHWWVRAWSQRRDLSHFVDQVEREPTLRLALARLAAWAVTEKGDGS